LIDDAEVLTADADEREEPSLLPFGVLGELKGM
jgi:hypothetical protein